MRSQFKPEDEPKCGLCWKTENLVKTDCCDSWVCDEAHKHVEIPDEPDSCFGKHDHYTLCSYHFTNRHKGDWKTCASCRKSFGTEIYVWYGTNGYNFSKLENPPEYEPTKCLDCGCLIVLSTDNYTRGVDGYRCCDCSNLHLEKRFRQITADREKEQMRKKEREASRSANVLFFPQLTPQAREEWNRMPKSSQDSILQSVWCDQCKESAMRLKSGTMDRDILVLEGDCVRCGGKVVRLVEHEDRL
jgi:hypothetical protein